MSDHFYKQTKHGFAVSRTGESNAIAINCNGRMAEPGCDDHIPFVGVTLFMRRDEARELAAVLLEAAGPSC